MWNTRGAGVLSGDRSHIHCNIYAGKPWAEKTVTSKRAADVRRTRFLRAQQNGYATRWPRGSRFAVRRHVNFFLQDDLCSAGLPRITDAPIGSGAPRSPSVGQPGVAYRHRRGVQSGQHGGSSVVSASLLVGSRRRRDTTVRQRAHTARLIVYMCVRSCIVFYFLCFLPHRRPLYHTHTHAHTHLPSPVARSLTHSFNHSLTLSHSNSLSLSLSLLRLLCRTRTVIFFVLLAMFVPVLLLRLHVVSCPRTEPSDDLHAAVAEQLWTTDWYHGMVVWKPRTRRNGPPPPLPPPSRRPWTIIRACRYGRVTVVLGVKIVSRHPRRREGAGEASGRDGGKPPKARADRHTWCLDGGDGPRPDAVKYVRVYASRRCPVVTVASAGDACIRPWRWWHRPEHMVSSAAPATLHDTTDDTLAPGVLVCVCFSRLQTVFVMYLFSYFLRLCIRRVLRENPCSWTGYKKKKKKNCIPNLFKCLLAYQSIVCMPKYHRETFFLPSLSLHFRIFPLVYHWP